MKDKIIQNDEIDSCSQHYIVSEKSNADKSMIIEDILENEEERIKYSSIKMAKNKLYWFKQDMEKYATKAKQKISDSASKLEECCKNAAYVMVESAKKLVPVAYVAASCALSIAAIPKVGEPAQMLLNSPKSFIELFSGMYYFEDKKWRCALCAAGAISYAGALIQLFSSV
ncbi:MAG: hypothetical protein WC393_04530 [Candidatus Nanoarchaeia archaeon]|jgi:hypothetical protein